MREYAKSTFVACDCRDYARVDLCVSDLGTLYVLDVVCIDLFASRGSYVRAANQAGYDFAQVMCRVVELARARYLTGERPQPELVSHTPSRPARHPARVRAAR